MPSHTSKTAGERVIQLSCILTSLHHHALNITNFFTCHGTKHKPMWLWSKICMVKVTKVCQWWVASVVIISIGLKVWKMSRKSVSRHFYKFNTNIYTRTTRTQKQYMKWKINIMAFVHGGCHLELPQKKALLGSLSGWACLWHKFHYKQWGGHMIL